MSKFFPRFFILLILTVLTVTMVPGAAAEETALEQSIAQLVENQDNRRFIQAMLNYYLEKDQAVRQTLEDGYSAVFFFEGCSDNLDELQYQDLTYYRVSAVCLALRMDAQGRPYLCYYNEDCSTLPDRPLEYGAWELADVGEVGPATICDGTYEIFSVRHGGAYEALHVRTDVSDGTLPAIYMTAEGYTRARATHINVHTRTSNHTIQGAMWSSGCLLVGGGDFREFLEMMDSVYYTAYDTFQIGDRVGTLTINRQCLKERLYELYQNTDAVDMLLASSRQILPERYLSQCSGVQEFQEEKLLQITAPTQLRTLPCSRSTDPRSLTEAHLDEGDEVLVTGAIRNSAGNVWYLTEKDGRTFYLFSGCTREPGWFLSMFRSVFG